MDERLRERILKRTAPGPNRCLLWTGARDLMGYGKVRTPGDREKMLFVHRAMKEVAEGPIPAGHFLRNSCGTRHCIEPAHWQATPLSQQGFASAASRRARTHIGRGHEMTPENTVMRKDGKGRWGRRCRICLRINQLPK